MSQRQRLLIVDDNPVNLSLLEELLADDYEVTTAASGEEALACVAGMTPGLILLDVMMPGMDGYEVCRRLRAHPTFSHLPIILISAKAMAEDLASGYAAGANAYVTKPFENDALLQQVRLLLQEDLPRMYHS